jgi:hypothetical protein
MNLSPWLFDRCPLILRATPATFTLLWEIRALDVEGRKTPDSHVEQI